MSEQKRDDRDDLCDHCGHKRRVHWCVNYSDGMNSSGEVLICPTAVFVPKDKRIGQ